MDDERIAAAMLRQQTLDECAEWNAWMEATRDEREARANAERARAASPLPAPAPVQHRRSIAADRMDDERIKALIEAHVAAAIRRHSGQALSELAEALGTELGSVAAKIERDLKDKVRGLQEQVRALEARLFELALRQGAAPVVEAPAKPEPLRLVGFSDAAG